jgi:hypothetical protein
MSRLGSEGSVKGKGKKKVYAMLLIKTPEWLFNANKLLKHLATIYIYTFFYQLFQIGS